MCSKTAFLCSRQIPASAVLKCYDWAIAQREAGNCVLSGFHSALEKDVLHYLLKGKQPLILALARGMKEKFEPELQDAIAQKRLLIITPFDRSVKRITSQTALLRNQFMLEHADNVTIGYARPGGLLESLLLETDKSLNRLEI